MKPLLLESSDWVVSVRRLRFPCRGRQRGNRRGPSESKVKEVRQYTEYAFVSDDLSMETLREIGLQNCDVVIVCIGEKVDISILTTMRVVDLGVPKVIAKAISEEQGAVLKKIGAEVVYPERDMAQHAI